MSEEERASGNDRAQEAEAYIAVVFVFDEKTNILRADLTKVASPSENSLQALQETLSKKGYSNFQYKPEVVESLAHKASQGETGSFEIAVRKEYTSIDFVFDENSNRLSAQFSVSYEDNRLNHGVVQEILKEKGFDTLTFHPGALQKAILNAGKNDRQELEIAFRKVYSDVIFHFDETVNLLHATLTNTFTDPQISLRSLHEELKLKGFDRFFFKEGVLESLLPKIQKAEEAEITVAEKKDAQVLVEFSRDKMEASISTISAFGGVELSADLVNQAVQSSGVDLSLCDQVVLLDVSKQESVSKVSFAVGVKYIAGEDCRFEALIGEINEKDRTVDDEAIVNHLDGNDFVMVEVGTPLMQKIPATAGTDGCNVLGEEIIAKPGDDFDFDIDLSGAIVDADNSNMLIAECDGHPIICARSVKVGSIIRLDDVDIKSGNVSFDGSLYVEGEVKAGFTVEVTGDVTVKGMIERATVIAGNDITVGGGVIGGDFGNEKSLKNAKSSEHRNEKSEENEKAPEKKSHQENLGTRLQAGGAIDVGFMSMVNAVAGGDIVAKEYVMHSYLESGNQILLGQAGGKGRLIGGKCFAAEGVLANEYGTDANVKTLVSAGTTITHSAELKELAESMDKKNEEVLSLSKIIAKMRSDIDSDGVTEVQQRLDTIINTVDVLREQIGVQAKEVEKVSKLVSDSSNIIISSRKQIFPNVEFCINGANIKFDQLADSGAYHESKGKVVKFKRPDE
ncbi:MAG: hypothetical protein ACJA2Q_001962 [Pseudohongiellaceae bacterium]